MRVLTLSVMDWANMGYLLAEALKAAGVEAKSACAKPHPFGYKKSATVLNNPPQFKQMLDWADTVIMMHSQPIKADVRDKDVWVFHGGTAYRTQHEAYNKWFNPMVKGSLIQTGDLFNLGAKNEKWLLPPIDTDALKPSYAYHKKTFAHYPRYHMQKGTGIIEHTFAVMGQDITIDLQQKQWAENINRMRKCDVYIEELAPPFEWGLTALEAAALGKIVITDFKSLKRYEKEYGKCELMVANTALELKQQVNKINRWNKEKLRAKKQATRKWAEKHHSFKAVGKRLRGILDGSDTVSTRKKQ